MTTIDDILRVTVQVDTKGVDNQFKALDRSLNAMDKKLKNIKRPPETKSFLGTGIDDVTPKLKRVESSFKSIGNVTRQVNADMKKLNATTFVFDARFLSIMFAGMQLQRTFGGALRGLLNTFDRLDNNQSELRKNVTGLRASFEFLKFSIFNALDQSFLFKVFIEGLINTINLVSDLINRFPILGKAVIGFIGAAATAGTVLFAFAQWQLAFPAITSVGKQMIAAMFGSSTLATITSWTDSAIKKIGGVGGALNKTIGVGLIIGATIQAFNFATSDAPVFSMESLKQALMAVGLGAAGLALLGVSLPWSLVIPIQIVFAIASFKILTRSLKRLLADEGLIAPKEQQFLATEQATAGFLGREQGTIVPEQFTNPFSEFQTNSEGLSSSLDSFLIPSLNNTITGLTSENDEFKSSNQELPPLAINFANLAESRSKHAEAMEEEATAKSNLAEANKDLAESIEQLNDANNDNDEETTSVG